MTIEEIKQKVASKEYNFLRENEHLGKNIILLGLGGSHAYGTNTEISDLDIRGIATNRKEEHDLLMDIRNGKYLDENRQPIPDFFELVDKLEKRLEYDKENTSLPDNPDYNRINDFVISVNERIVKGEL